MPYRSAVCLAGAILGVAVLAGCADDDVESTATTTTEAVAPETSTAQTTATTPETSAPESTDGTAPAIPTSPDGYATAFVDAWASGDRAAADLLGTDDAVNAIFAVEGGGIWVLLGCDGAAGSSYCTFSAGGDPTLIIRVGNEAASQGEPHAVIEVREETPAKETSSTTPPTSEAAIPTDPESYATAFVDAWASGDRDRAELLGTDDAVVAIFAFEGGGTWALLGCEGAMGSSYCTFSAGGDPTLIIRVGNEAASQGQPDAVIEVRVEN